MLPIAAPGDPANEVVTIRRREREDLDEFDRRLAGKLHQDEVRVHRLRRLVARRCHSDFGGDGPQIFAVIKDDRICHVIETVGGGLQAQQQLGVAHVSAKIGGHGRGIFEQLRKDVAIGRDDGIVWIEDVEGRRSVICVDHHFHAVSHVVDLVVAERVVGRVGIVVRGGKCVEHPREPAVVADHDVRDRNRM